MTPAELSAWCTACALAAFLAIVSFNLGRLNANAPQLRSACDLSAEDRMDLKANWYVTKGLEP
jgi:hypothetical protein